MKYEEKINAFVNLLKGSSRTFALTGAGISTESGIPDYRSPGTGLWNKFDPMKVACTSALRRDPAAFYQNNLKRWITYSGAEPNPAHYALAKLEREGFLIGVITQNIDGLHRKAGSQKVWEVHGHLRTCHCFDCKNSYPFEYLINQFDAGKNPPRCDKCNGVLRPDIVLFEDSMGDDYFQATKAISGCQLLIVVGSSLQVYPVASLPDYARQLVIINQDDTPRDSQADLVIHEKSGQVFIDTLAALGLKKEL
ncbi:MAG: NAD-dependent protein deacetylase [Pelotomaculum sp. PtaB.Bin013]|uniref:protein acetyllysine N-acetyltransferase n=1 Tax=Pelotomaculum isophthalicicum JI TaxID=947010 RepID=A0A9X4GZU6_9FIRM|nr:Sir2 family NAD-dependent protein deacetylase [Pelotomaculum isophthalicicum]MDF9409187.1 Sir2 family NAD-dependent protein deacetylase [Pelotomaculum isophthalicicum JI]OPX90670.1 MAG: NAD-dependent protein deacetylase [Pelotomaculum sp. PtaB.Bin013]